MTVVLFLGLEGAVITLAQVAVPNPLDKGLIAFAGTAIVALATTTVHLYRENNRLHARLEDYLPLLAEASKLFAKRRRAGP